MEMETFPQRPYRNFTIGGLPLVELEWIDPHGIGGGKWMNYKTLEEEEDFNPTHCRTAGYLYRRTEDTVVIFASLSVSSEGEIEEVGDGLVIPRGNVIRINYL